MALVTELVERLTANLTATAGLTTAQVPLALEDHFQLASGTGSGQADKIYTLRNTLGASAAASLDLAGSLSDGLGTALTFVTIKLVRVTAASGNTNDVQVTRPASNGAPLFLAAGDGLSVRPGGVFTWCAPGVGVTVTAATGDLLTFTNSAGSTGVTYDVVIIGTSA